MHVSFPESKRLRWLLYTLCIVCIVAGGYFLIAHTPFFQKTLSRKHITSETESENTRKNENAYVNVNATAAGTAPNGYHISGNTVYHDGKKIDDADPATFQELEDRWAKDSRSVYHEGNRQAFLDPVTVKVLPIQGVLQYPRDFSIS